MTVCKCSDHTQEHDPDVVQCRGAHVRELLDKLNSLCDDYGVALVSEASGAAVLIVDEDTFEKLGTA